MKHLITGGAGFIGSHLADRLVEQGETVMVIDDLSLSNFNNIRHLTKLPNFDFIQTNLRFVDKFPHYFFGHDIVWHFGANTNIRKGDGLPNLDFQNGTIVTFNVLEDMRKGGVKKLVFASSAAVYGDNDNTVLSEDFAPLLPISLYGASKLACEGMISAYSNIFGIQALIFRFANVVGARMNHGLIYNLIRQLKTDPHELEIFADGKQEKSFFLIEDCLDGMFRIMGKCKEQCNIFNLGAETTTTATRVGEIVCEVMGLKDVKFRYTGGRRGWASDVPKVFYNIDKAKFYGWQTKYTSDEAVRIATERILEE